MEKEVIRGPTVLEDGVTTEVEEGPVRVVGCDDKERGKGMNLVGETGRVGPTVGHFRDRRKENRSWDVLV